MFALALLVTLAAAPASPCAPADEDEPRTVPVAEAERSFSGLRKAWAEWCSAPPGTASVAGPLREAQAFITSMQQVRDDPKASARLGDPYGGPLPPGVALLYGDLYLLDFDTFRLAAEGRGTPKDRKIWRLHHALRWPGGLAVERGLMEPGDSGCLLLSTVDLVAAVDTVQRLQAAATGPEYRALAEKRRAEVLGPLERASLRGACLCEAGLPGVERSLKALAAARGRGTAWRPYAEAAEATLKIMRRPGHFQVVKDYSCQEAHGAGSAGEETQ